MSAKGEVHFIGVVAKVGEETAEVRVFPEFCRGLKNIADFSHLIILYWIHLRDNEKERKTLVVIPRKHGACMESGVFACRSPSRPNPIGFCVVELKEIRECILIVKGLDALQDSPVIDIKPYLPRADCVPDAQVPDWVEQGPAT
jgi:tRNA-Thr(GGU) m(6)t(6)A37 methyltransferase TsaA